MKAFSIKQPWAWLICKGIKDVENRTWWLHMPPLLNHPSYAKNVPMRIYVHAGKSKIPFSELFSIVHFIEERGLNLFEEFPGAIPPDEMFGAIIGEVDIVGCKYRFGEENDNLYSKWHEVGMYGFYLANPVLYDIPFPCKGKLGLFEPIIQKD
jgi:hypothetical protein